MNNGESIGWEIATIGSVIADPVMMELAEDLAPVDFTGSHRLIWRAILHLHRGGALEPRALIEDLRSSGDLDKVGTDMEGDLVGEAYIRHCWERRGGQVEEYVQRVIEVATKRQLREAAALIAAEAVGTGNAEDLLDEAERRIMQLRRARGVTGVTVGQLISAFIPRLEGMRAGTITPAFVPHCQAIKELVDFVDDNDFILIAGRPGDGKSSYLRYEAFWKSKAGIPGLMFNLENTESEYAKAFIALETGIDGALLRNPRLLTAEQLETVKRAAQKLASYPLEIITLGGPSVADIERIARAKMRTLKPKYIMLDYIQLVNNGLDSEVANVSKTSTSLKSMGMANRLNVPIICAAQLNREIERRGARSEPQLSDLRESGSLEQDATMVIFPREAWWDPREQEIRRFPENVEPFSGRLLPRIRAVPIRFYVKKNRNGPTGITGMVKWCKHTGGFFSLTEEEAR